MFPFHNRSASMTPNPKHFETERELILYVIDKSYGFTSYSDHSELYEKYARSEWKADSKYFTTEYSLGLSFRAWDSAKLEYLADNCDDVDILRAIFESGKLREDRYVFVTNENIPDDVIIGLCEKHRSHLAVLKRIRDVKYKYITEEAQAKIAATIVECEEKIRKDKEVETKQKLTAFLTTAAATKSVLIGNSIDDVVEQTITSDIDDTVLDYMNQLFGKK